MYRHIFPNGKVYIGYTGRKPAERWESGNGYKQQTLVYRAIQHYGWDNIIHEIVAQGLTKNEARALEVALITADRATNRQYGYNVTPGGECGNNRLSVSNSGKPVVQYSLSGDYIREWANARTAFLNTRIDSAHISQVCNSKRKTAGGFVWKFKE